MEKTMSCLKVWSWKLIQRGGFQCTIMDWRVAYMSTYACGKILASLTDSSNSDVF